MFVEQLLEKYVTMITSHFVLLIEDEEGLVALSCL